MYFHAYIDGVDFVFIDSPVFRHLNNNIYSGNRLVRLVLFSLFFTEKNQFQPTCTKFGIFESRIS